MRLPTIVETDDSGLSAHSPTRSTFLCERVQELSPAGDAREQPEAMDDLFLFNYAAPVFIHSFVMLFVAASLASLVLHTMSCAQWWKLCMDHQ